MGDALLYHILVQSKRVLFGQGIRPSGRGVRGVLGPIFELCKLFVDLLPAVIQLTETPSEGLIVEGIVVIFDFIRQKIVVIIQ